MGHGSQEYFDEKERCDRRVSALAAGTGVFLLVLLLVAMTPPVHRTLNRMPVMRFGFAGPPRYVNLVRIEAVPGLDEPLQDVGSVVSLPRTAGGGGIRSPGGRPGLSGAPTRSGVPGAGEQDREVAARLQTPRSRLPVFQSEDLIIEHLVRPEYPEDARQRGVEGRVSVLALVDTLGRVIEANVSRRSGEPQLDSAARRAVLKCRFRPYREFGRVREVYAEFHFAFRID